MSSLAAKGRKLLPYETILEENQAISAENRALKAEIENLRARLEEAGELERAITEGDLDALIIPGQQGELVFTLDSADRAYRVLVETMREGTLTLGFEGTILYCNHSFAELLGANPQTIVGTPFYKFIPPEHISRFNAFLSHKTISDEINLQASDGRSIPVYMSISSLQVEGHPNGWCIVVTDLTEQKKNEEIVANERLSRSIIEQSAEVIAVCDIYGRIIRFSSPIEEICGCDPTFHYFEDVIDLKCSKGTNSGKNIFPVSQALIGSSVLGMEVTGESRDCKRIFNLLLNSGPLKNSEGKIIGCVLNLTNITRLKQAEEELQQAFEEMQAQAEEMEEQSEMLRALSDELQTTNKELKESESRYRLIVENAGEGIWIISPSGWTLFANRQMAEMLCTSAGELQEKPVFDFMFEEDLEAGAEMIRRGFEAPSQHFEFRYRRKDGQVLWASVNSNVIHDDHDRIAALQWMFTDFTERKRAEEELIKAHSQIQNIIDNTPDIVYAFDPEERFVLANRAVANVLNSTPDQMIGKRRQEFMLKEDANWQEANDRQVFVEGRVLEFEEYSHLEGRMITWLAKKFPLYDAQGRIYAVAGISADISERKRAEEALKIAHDTLEEKVKERTAELEEAYDSLLENELRLSEAQKIAHLGNWVWDPQTDELFWSDEVYRIFGTDPLKFGGTYNAFLDCVHPEDRGNVISAIKEAFNGKPFAIDHTIIRENGEERIVYLHGSAIFSVKNVPLRMKGIVQDITERKKAQEALQNIEKIRIKEIHHRIKNNLQVISSLLDLQAEKFEDESVVEAIKEGQNRVVSMALIHEELYKGEGKDKLDFSTYLKKLAESLFSTYRINTTDVLLHLDLEENAFLNMDTAVPLGIIVNELVSNSLKHAFNKDEAGEIQIQLCRGKMVGEAGTSLFSLTVSDNGKGIPEELDIENVDSLGLQLVTILVDQLDGEIELNREQGTEFRVTFSIQEDLCPA